VTSPCGKVTQPCGDVTAPQDGIFEIIPLAVGRIHGKMPTRATVVTTTPGRSQARDPGALLWREASKTLGEPAQKLEAEQRTIYFLAFPRR
jgi:hypothetical protein